MTAPNPPPPSPKKVYRTPKLTVYGNIRELTGTLGGFHPRSDGGPVLMNKTS